ncbi:FAD-dependent monooxygenase [Amycolatopsis nigrescens]|uniref:FAD-dependent monooxygenase n=1 Tax=Amycolatopsis nigrescens TaxID=381445 RepID=UPI00035DFF60|nr:FAD-dependent monooxygenase [Amycolatopsis nigrescens]
MSSRRENGTSGAGRSGPELLVVGAGPAGLTSALAASALGIDVTVLEAEPADRVRAGSRALFVHRENLRRLDRMSPGLGMKIAGFGITWRARRTFYGGREVFAREYPAPDTESLPPYASLRQIDTEQFLMDACLDAGVRFVWDAPIEDVRSTPDGVTALTADGRSWQAPYLIGADGGRSAVRKAVGITLEGGRSTDYRVAVDLEDPVDTAPSVTGERINHYRHPRVDLRNLFIVPFAGGRQVDLQCRTKEDAEIMGRPEEVRRWLPKVVDPGYLDRILWIARYPCLQLVADRFTDRHRRVLLAGEAAHLFAPLGARGMNSGIADADAAAGAVGLALRSANPERAKDAVDKFADARKQAGDHNCAAASAGLAHVRAGNVVARTRQSLAARLSPVVPRFGAWLDEAPYGPRGAIRQKAGTY